GFPLIQGTPQHEEICLGLFTLVLTEPAQAQKCYRDLALVSRDGMNIVLNKINHILMEKYLKLQDTCRTQLVWLLRELVKSGVLGADGVCMTFMKQIAGGDVTAKNIWLAENVLEILTEQRYNPWDLPWDGILGCSWMGFGVLVTHRQPWTWLPLIPWISLPRIPWILPMHPTAPAHPDPPAAPQDPGLGSRGSHPLPPPEPAILVMHHSMKPHPAITATLLDFMCRIIPNFYPPLEAHVRQGVFNSLTHIVEKRVLAIPGTENLGIPRDTEIPGTQNSRIPKDPGSPGTQSCRDTEFQNPMDTELDTELQDPLSPALGRACRGGQSPVLPVPGKKREFRFHPIKESIVEEPVDITPFLEQLDESLKDKVLQLQKGSDTEAQCEVMQEIVDQVLEEDFDSEQLSVLASCLQELFKAHFRGEVLPEEITEESLEESVGKPLYLIFRNLCQMQEDNSGFSLLLDLLSELYQKQPKIGYHLLYYLRASKAALGRMGLYESFAQATQLGELHTCLMMDMKACQEDDVRLLCFLTPSIYRFGGSWPQNPIPCPPPQLQELVCHVMMGNLVMFRKDSVLNILSE
uniref:Integrator complex subunit 3 n=1 Tax=Ficedula albicollis TaxID=59894 RepID=A0A803V2A9_FICAL